MTKNELMQLLSYDANTGLFVRLKRTCNRINVGDIAGWKDADGYLNISLHGKKWKSHRLAWLYVYGKFPEQEIDHINGIKSDNRLCNLRQATRSQNCTNRGMPSHNKSGFKGVQWRQHAKKFCAVIYKNKKKFFLGYFDTAEKASEVYLKASFELHGDFAKAQEQAYQQEQRAQLPESPL